MTDLPEPFTAPDCNCQGLPFMPMALRVRDSDFVALSTGDEFKAGFMLWSASWTQVPAASLPDDDRLLAHLVRVSLSEWMKLREMALHGFVKCSDGRLYHPLIADLASAAMAKRKGQSERANSRWEKERARKRASGVPADKKPTATVSPENATVMQGRGIVEGTEPPLYPPLPGGSGPDEIKIAFDEWNDLAKRLDLPIALDLTQTRRSRIAKRLEGGGLERWRQALGAAERSRHCRGQNDRGWKASLDFVCQASSFQKLIEGTYGSDAEAAATSSRAPPPIIWNGPDEVRAIVASRMGLDFAGDTFDRHCRWRDLPDKAITSALSYVTQQIRTDCNRELRAIGVEVVHVPQEAAA